MSLPEQLPTLTVKAAATALGVHASTVYRWVEAGELPAIRYGRHPKAGARRRGGEIRIPECAIADRLAPGLETYSGMSHRTA